MSSDRLSTSHIACTWCTLLNEGIRGNCSQNAPNATTLLKFVNYFSIPPRPPSPKERKEVTERNVSVRVLPIGLFNIDVKAF